MGSALLYSLVVLIWGTSWIMIYFQVGVVPPEVSVAYRFILAALLMFLWVVILRLPVKYSLRHHFFFLCQGLFIFCTNYVLFYYAALYLASGLLAVVFSAASIFTVLLNILITRQAPKWTVLLGSLIGVLGISLIFWPEILSINNPGALKGLLLSILGTLSFCIGGLISRRNQSQGISIRASTAWSMFYGACLLNLFILAKGGDYLFDESWVYISSLVYLAIFGSVIAFVSYFTLLSKIGAEKAAYVTVMFPIVALALSTLFENYHWTPLAVMGVLLALGGNFLVLKNTN